MKTTIWTTFFHQFSLEKKGNAELLGSNFQVRAIWPRNTLLLGAQPLTNLVKQLNLKLVGNMLRCDRRLSNAMFPFDAKFSMLIPLNSHLKRLLIWHLYNTHRHLEISELVLISRRQFYFTRMKTTVGNVIRPCVLWKRLQAVYFCSAPLAALPCARVVESMYFTNIGLDLTYWLFQRKNPAELLDEMLHYLVYVRCH